MSQRKEAVREAFRRACFERAGYRCEVCGDDARGEEHLDAHHITDRHELPAGGYVEANGITLCPSCHELAEVYHQRQGWDWAPGYHPNALYFRIGSSYERAKAQSLRLERRSEAEE